jgi:hypothetical protein
MPKRLRARDSLPHRAYRDFNHRQGIEHALKHLTLTAVILLRLFIGGH